MIHIYWSRGSLGFNLVFSLGFFRIALTFGNVNAHTHTHTHTHSACRVCVSVCVRVCVCMVTPCPPLMGYRS
jgi:hypothetical protein